MTNEIDLNNCYTYTDGLLRPADVAQLLAISRSTLNKYTRLGFIAAPVVLGSTMVRYRREDVFDFLNELKPKHKKTGGG